MQDVKPLTAEEIAELRRKIEYDEISGRTVRDALPRLLDEVERTRALLRRIEWKGMNLDGWGECDGAACPDCEAPEKDNGNHAPGCELAALLGGEG